MYGKIVLVLQLYIVAGICYKRQEKPCHYKDLPCVTNSVANVFDAAINADPSAGFEAIDPMHHDVITADYPNVSLTLKNCTVIGHKGLKIESAIISDHNIVTITIAVPRFEISGVYDVSGNYHSSPLIGSGQFTLNATDVKLNLKAVKRFYKRDDKVYMNVKSFDFAVDPIGKLQLDAEHLMIGIGAPGMSTIEDKMLQDIWYPAIARANMDKLFKNVNKIIDNIPHAELVVDVPDIIIEDN